MTNFGTPQKMSMMPYEDAALIPDILVGAYTLPGYNISPDLNETGRWFHVKDDESYLGVVWTNDDESCGVAVPMTPEFDHVGHACAILTLRRLKERQASATDAFNVLADTFDVTRVTTGRLVDMVYELPEE